MTTAASVPGARTVRRYVLSVAAAGLAAALGLANWLSLGPLEPALLVPLTIAAVLSLWAPLRFRHRGEVAGFTLEGAVLVAMLFTLPGGLIPPILGGAALLAHLARRSGWQKPVFNTGLTLVASSASVLVFELVHTGGPVMSTASIAAVVLATITFDLFNVVSFSELFRRLEGRSYAATVKDTWRLYLVTWVGNTSFGLLLAFVALEDALATLLASTLMIGLYIGYRGYAGVLEERERTERLHDVTQALASATGSPDALHRFLNELTRLFGGERGDAVLIVRERVRYVTTAEERTVDQPGEHLPRLLDEALHSGRAILRSEVDEDANHRDALAAPLIFEDNTIGAIAVYDRHGLEPWDETDVKLLATLAHEAAVAVKNVELVADLSDESRKLGNIVSAASDGIALVDGHGRIITWNPAFERMTGRRSGDVIGRPWDAALEVEEERSWEQLEGVMTTVLTGRAVDLPVDLHIARAPGDLRWLRCTFAPVDPDDEGEDTAGAVLVARDVTREREAEELKSDFIATVSHELRTPLTPLKGFLTTAESRWDDLDREQLRQMVTAMRRQVDRLEALIADLLTVADLDRDRAALVGGEIDLSGEVQAAIETLPVAAAARVEMVGDTTVPATGDARAVRRVVRALTDNALKHTTGMVTVTVGGRGRDATVSVSDEGPGIGEWDRDRIFERFGRLGNHLTRDQGPGLGLAIARSLAERLGGRLELESEVGTGSTFVLVLPRPSPETVRASAG